MVLMPLFPLHAKHRAHFDLKKKRPKLNLILNSMGHQPINQSINNQPTVKRPKIKQNDLYLKKKFIY